MIGGRIRSNTHYSVSRAGMITPRAFAVCKQGYRIRSIPEISISVQYLVSRMARWNQPHRYGGD
jgi:hypothetical protein